MGDHDEYPTSAESITAHPCGPVVPALGAFVDESSSPNGAGSPPAPDDEIPPGPYTEQLAESAARFNTQERREQLRASGFETGGTFVLDGPATPPAVWGDDTQVLWSSGEPALFVGPAGVGKTTLASQLVLAALGILDDVLDLPVVQTDRRLLYLAMDRPTQIKSVFRRLVSDEHRELLDERLVIRRGPPPHDLARHPETLTELCQQVDADVVWIDSLKDAAIGLSDDEVGAGINRAFQTAITANIEVAALHHQRKGDGTRKPKTLEDVYGSVWITNGAGSVVLLWGAAGDPIVDLLHLKQPSAEVGPWKIEHDHLTGRSRIHRGQIDPLTVLQAHARDGLTIDQLARLMTEKEKVNDSDRGKARYQLDRLVKQNLATRTDAQRGGTTGTTPARYYPTNQTFPTGKPTGHHQNT